MNPFPNPSTPVVSGAFFTLPFMNWFRDLSKLLQDFKVFSRNDIMFSKVGNTYLINYNGPSNKTLTLPSNVAYDTYFKVNGNTFQSVKVVAGSDQLVLPDNGTVSINEFFLGDN